MKIILAILFALATPLAFAQTTIPAPMATVTITAPMQTPTVSISPATQNVPAGIQANVTIGVSGATGSAVPTGTVTLWALAPGSTSWVSVQDFQLVNGQAVCTYAVPASAPTGPYGLRGTYKPDAASSGIYTPTQ